VESGHFVAQTPGDWFAEQISDAKNDIVYHKEHWLKAQRNAAEATSWLNRLYASVLEEPTAKPRTKR
jgi:hypothetical protein